MSLCIVHPFTPPEHCGITSLTLPQHYQPVCWARAAVSHKVHLCQYKQEVAKAVFPWKFSGGIAKLTPGIPSHWGNNWHSWDREKQTSPNMFWWSLPMRWCLWRAAESRTSQYKGICKTPLTLVLKPGYNQNDHLLSFSFLQHHGKCWRISLHNFYMVH